MKDFDKVRIASYLLPDPGGEVVRELLDEIELLRAVIGAPEVYAGVVTEVLECERDRAIRKAERLQEWKVNVLGVVKCIPEYESGEWGGDKEGWGFVFELIKWQTSRVAQLQSIINELGSWASAALDDPKVCDELKQVFARVVEVAE